MEALCGAPALRRVHYSGRNYASLARLAARLPAAATDRAERVAKAGPGVGGATVASEFLGIVARCSLYKECFSIFLITQPLCKTQKWESALCMTFTVRLRERRL